MLLDNDLRRRMGEAGREFVTARYSIDACVDRMVDEYRRVLGAR